MGAGGNRRFPPLYADAAAARTALLHLVRRDPHQLGESRTRWTLASIQRHAEGIHVKGKSSMCRLLQRLGIVWKRGRSCVLSPDANYAAKLEDIARSIAEARQRPGQVVAVYADQVTIRRQPTVAPAYAERGCDQARARRSHAADTETRIMGSLDALSARVVFRRGKVTTTALVAFYKQLVAAYPAAERIYVILDNWPVHYHPDVLVALEPQETRWPLTTPPSWPTQPSPRALRRNKDLALPIQLVPLPTYASWANPIEKLWRKLRQDLTHLHPWADDLNTLRQRIDQFLDAYAQGSTDLLRYVGLECAE